MRVYRNLLCQIEVFPILTHLQRKYTEVERHENPFKRGLCFVNGLYWVLEQLQPHVLLIKARCSSQLVKFNVRATEISIKLC